MTTFVEPNSDLWPPQIRKNFGILSPIEKKIVDMLLQLNQGHLFEHWADAGTDDDLKHQFFKQIQHLDSTYGGGLSAYISSAKRLLLSAKNGENPLQGWLPSIPQGVTLNPITPEYLRYETIGQTQLHYCGFVLVAGGLGERLGYSGIKVELPVESSTSISYLSYYCAEILSIQNRYCTNGELLPFVIMVSDDTASRTWSLLTENEFFGLKMEQITVMKQEKVAALSSSEATIAQLTPYEVDCKPHGHGDVHSLMHSTGTASAWYNRGTRWWIFMQDTNSLSLFNLPAVLGVSVEKDYQVNSLAIPRVAKQAVGAITKLTNSDTGRTVIVNVEYNQLDPLLRNSGSPMGDVNDVATGLSPFPGNINLLVFAAEPYVHTLVRTHGNISEFVNPKYVDANERIAFKKPARLESMMQDYPFALNSSQHVGFSLLPAFCTYNPCKNNIADAAILASSGIPAASAFTAESEHTTTVTKLLIARGSPTTMAGPVSFGNISAVRSPRIIVHPSSAIFPCELSHLFPHPECILMSPTSTLIVEGNVVINNLTVQGSVRIIASPNTQLIVGANDKVVIENKGREVVDISNYSEGELTEQDKMRGYKELLIEEMFIRTPANLATNNTILRYGYDGKTVQLL